MNARERAYSRSSRQSKDEHDDARMASVSVSGSKVNGDA